MGYSESDTRAKLIDPALRACGWTEAKGREVTDPLAMLRKKARCQPRREGAE